RTVPRPDSEQQRRRVDERLARDWGLRLMSAPPPPMRPLGIYSPNLDPLTALGIERAATRNATAMRSRRCRRNRSAWARRWPTSGPTTRRGSGSSGTAAREHAGCEGAGRRQPGLGPAGGFRSAECPSCEQRVRQLQVAGTAFDLLHGRQPPEDARIRQWRRRPASTPAARPSHHHAQP
ncbi:hypothetical protein J4732_18455, partial [Serratia marcescens]|nr:hypothetical protein [Serratia marcescens]